MLVSHFGLRAFGRWPPGYEALLGGTFALAGPDALAAKCVQLALSLGLVALVYALGRRAAGRRAGRIAAWLAALDPTFIAYTHYLFSETLFLTLLGAAMLAVAWDPEGRSGRARGLAGALFGLAGLTRSVALYFLPLWAAWEWLRGRRRRALHATGILAAALALVAPWTAWNAVRYRAFQLVDATLVDAAYFAFSEVPMNQDLGFAWLRPPRSRAPCPDVRNPHLEPLPPTRELEGLFPTPSDLRSVLPDRRALRRTIDAVRRYASLDDPALQRCELAAAWTFAREHPGLLTRQILWRFYDFWGPNSFLLRASHMGVYPDGPLARGHYAAVKWLFVAGYLPLVAAAILAFGRRELPDFARFAGLFLAYYTAIHMLAVASSRYRLPVMPLVIVLASLWLADPRLPEGRGRGIGVGLALAGFAGLCAHYLITRLP